MLLDEKGWSYAAIGQKLKMREQTVLKWRKRFLHNRLAKRPGYHLHFTPTSASWINQVEQVLADLAEK